MNQLLKSPNQIIAAAIASVLISSVGGGIVSGRIVSMSEAELDDAIVAVYQREELRKDESMRDVIAERAKAEQLRDQAREDRILAQMSAMETRIMARVGELTMKTHDRVYRYEVLELLTHFEDWAREWARAVGLSAPPRMPTLSSRPDPS